MTRAVLSGSAQRLAVAIVCAAVLGVGWRPGTARPAVAEPPPPAPVADTAFAANFGGMRLTDQDGRAFEWGAVRGQVVLVNFVFTGCSAVCPVQTQALAQVRQRLSPALQRQVQFVSVSLDPLNDTPAALKRFAQRQGADAPAWRFVTGRPADAERIAQRLRLFATAASARKPDDHTTSLYLIDRDGRLVQRYSGTPPDQARLARELTSLSTLSARRAD